MFNTQITELQSENQIEELGELSESELKAVVGGNPQTEVGKALLKGLETLVRSAEAKLEDEVKALSAE